MLPRSSVSHVRWPALPGAAGALMLAMQHQLSESQWLAPAALEHRQLEALSGLLDHACRTVPHYRDSPAHLALSRRGRLDIEGWRALPVLSREALQEAGARMHSDEVPADHQPVSEILTTGSTGRPVRGLTTRVTRLLWGSLTVRDVLWHGYDLSGKVAAIRADMGNHIPPQGAVAATWAPMLGATFETGPCALLSIDHDVARQADWLVEQDPDYLLTYPSNVVALADQFGATGAKLPRLRAVSTYGEALGADVRPACRRAWDVPVVDIYSAQELGYLALQCPGRDTYHVQSEAVLVEVLDEGGQPCPPGQVGRVVVSTLHNYAMPMLRYEIGDYAEVGGPCPCGRGLPVLTRIAGRRRNMWTLPGGRRVWPMFSSRRWGHIDAIRQLQLVQHALDHIEARIVGPRPLDPAEAAELEALLRDQFPFPFRLTLTPLDAIDRTVTRKFEDFVSLVPPG